MMLGRELDTGLARYPGHSSSCHINGLCSFCSHIQMGFNQSSGEDNSSVNVSMSVIYAETMFHMLHKWNI